MQNCTACIIYSHDNRATRSAPIISRPCIQMYLNERCLDPLCAGKTVQCWELCKDGPLLSNLYLLPQFWGHNPTLTPAVQATFKPAVKALTSHYYPPPHPLLPWSGGILWIFKQHQNALILTDSSNHMQMWQAGGEISFSGNWRFSNGDFECQLEICFKP